MVFEVSARADGACTLFSPSQKESPLGVPTQSAHPGTPLLCLLLSYLSRCNNMVFLCCQERCSITYGCLIY
jgi:hypothetical protein